MEHRYLQRVDFYLSGQPPGLVAFFSNKFCGLGMLHWCTHRCWSHFSLQNLVALKYESLCSANHYKWTKIVRHLNVYFLLCISVEELKVYVMLVVVNFGNYCRNICGNHISIVYFPVRFENTTSISFPVALPSKPAMYVWKQNWVTLDLTVFCDHFFSKAAHTLAYWIQKYGIRLHCSYCNTSHNKKIYRGLTEHDLNK